MPAVRDDRHRPIQHSSYNPELNCFLPLDNEFDYAFLEVLESLKVDNIKPQMFMSSSRLSRYTKRCLPPAEGAPSKELLEKVAK